MKKEELNVQKIPPSVILVHANPLRSRDEHDTGIQVNYYAKRTSVIARYEAIHESESWIATSLTMFTPRDDCDGFHLALASSLGWNDEYSLFLNL